MMVLRLCSLAALCLLCTPACDSPNGGAGDGPAADLATPNLGREPKRHRPAATACSATRPAGPVVGMGRGTCQSDKDCSDATMGSNGRCVFSRSGANCSYDTCSDDSSCGAKVCQCRPAETVASASTNHCLSLGDCRIDSDCGAGGYCSPSFSTCGNYSGVVAYYCHTPTDTCIDDEDCGGGDGGLGGPGYCMFSPQGSRWICGYTQCAG